MRLETKKVLEHTKNGEEKRVIESYVEDGWDHYWPFPRRPPWLQDRYSISKEQHEIKERDD